MVWPLTLVFALTSGLQHVSDLASKHTPAWVERGIGDAVIRSVNRLAPQFDQRDHDALAKRLALIERLQRMAAHTGLPPLRIHWAIGPVNAFAAPGGVVVFTSAALDALSLDELVAVGAHEIGHLVHRHGLRNLYQALSAGVLIELAMGSSYAGAVGDKVVGGLARLKFSRDDERQADSTAHQLLRQNGYSPQHLADAFRTLRAQSGQRLEWLSTHPDIDERIQAAERATK